MMSSPREICNLFLEFPGYESSHLRTPTHTSQPFAFAVFSDQQSAIVVMHTLTVKFMSDISAFKVIRQCAVLVATLDLAQLQSQDQGHILGDLACTDRLVICLVLFFIS
ncbi:hypothetical protein F2P56_002047 [Juglans regia]|uniref:Uncharacterized protein n=1 Tax=Juglans regia TaxID=51240 RepID=A0A833YBK7_JUGRE|nr:hypothetical protein F2P56_002047 [Juglans regia]